MITSIYIGSDKLDLYKDDNIILKSSIAEIEDVSKIFTDSTNNYSVPATDNNNKIFKHFYNANLVNGWDVFNKVDAVIELDGFIYKQGKIKLNSVVTNSNIPISYEIQYYGNLTELKDILSDDKLTNLDFGALNFNYNSTNVIDKLTNAINTDTIATTLTNKRLIYDSDNAVHNTDTIRNIAPNGVSLNNGLNWDEVSISVKNIKIIEAIETKYGITFSRDFFGLTAFDNLYMLLNGDTLGEIEQQIVFDGLQEDPTLENNRVLLSTNLTYSDTYFIRIDGIVSQVVESDIFTVIIKSNDNEIFRQSYPGLSRGFVIELFKSDFETFENLTFFFKSRQGINYDFNTIRQVDVSGTEVYLNEMLAKTITGIFNVSSKMPDLKVIDYLKGIFRMFKCIAFFNEDVITVKTLQDFYDEGVVKDFTKYIDFSEIPISIGNIFNEINYKFKEPKTILAKQFFKINNVNFGDLEFSIVDANGKKVEGNSIDVQLPFENMIYEKLYDNSNSDTVNFMYGYMADESLNPAKVTAHLHYVMQIDTISEIKLISGTSTTTTTSIINIPIHTLGISNPSYSTVFGEEFNEYNGVLIQNTLYKNYHKNYIVNAFNENKRLYQFKAKELPIPALLNLKLNDILLIKDQYYRINKYDINLITRQINLECYNIKEL